MTGRLRKTSFAWLAMVALLVGAASAWADARDVFKEAMELVEARDWAGAETKLREAVRLDSAEDKRTFIKDYLPHYWLGVALQEQQDCRGAMKQFEESKRQGVATESKDSSDLSQRMTRCRETLDQLDQALAEAQSAVEAARKEDVTLDRMSGSPELASHWAPFENRRQSALAKLTESERLMERGRAEQDLDPIREAADNAAQVASQLLTIAADARAKAGQVSRASDAAQGDLEEAEAQASLALRAVQPLEPLPPELARQAEDLRGYLGEIEEVQASGNSRRMRDLSRQVVESIRQLKNMADPPPTWLSQAAQNYLDQEYAAALAEIETRLGRAPRDGETEAPPQAPRLEPRERFHALLLAAAARHQLWVADGRSKESDHPDLNKLRADLGEAAAIEAKALAGDGRSLGRASLRFLSPELRSMWGEALIEAGVELPADEPLLPEPQPET